ncbi:DUF4241 domain-containing protein [Streptomyces erythrochromogenes]|uniref:DUF4241 domain-containing protein n=1 Tax=Streptomyces erythrochromogenes TaxID=285574 RepID=UPI003700807B
MQDRPAPATCWRPPRPAQPGPINELFRPGVRVTDGYHPEMTVVEPCRVGTLRVPSGLLAVSGPDADEGEGPCITVPVPPGAYVLDEARVRYSYHCEWRDREVTTTTRTAVRLLVGETPAATWEMALGPDDDLRLFIEEQTAAFDTDGATGCFADAGAWEPLVALFERGLIQGEPDLDVRDLRGGARPGCRRPSRPLRCPHHQQTRTLCPGDVLVLRLRPARGRVVGARRARLQDSAMT